MLKKTHIYGIISAFIVSLLLGAQQVSAQWLDQGSSPGQPGFILNNGPTQGDYYGPSVPYELKDKAFYAGRLGAVPTYTNTFPATQGLYTQFDSGQYSFGFTGSGQSNYQGGYLPPTATSSVDINITE